MTDQQTSKPISSWSTGACTTTDPRRTDSAKPARPVQRVCPQPDRPSQLRRDPASRVRGPWLRRFRVDPLELAVGLSEELLDLFGREGMADHVAHPVFDTYSAYQCAHFLSYAPCRCFSTNRPCAPIADSRRARIAPVRSAAMVRRPHTALTYGAAGRNETGTKNGPRGHDDLPRGGIGRGLHGCRRSASLICTRESG